VISICFLIYSMVTADQNPGFQPWQP